MEKISWTDSAKNESITQSQGGKKHPIIKKEGRLTGLVIACLRTGLKTRY
jgi:hypothetical protein